MSFARGYTDKIRCEVSNCRETYWAGSMFHAETSETTLQQARELGWDVSGRHLCPKHAGLAKPAFHSAPNHAKYQAAADDPKTGPRMANFAIDANGCHVWGGLKDQEGYGLAHHNGRPLRAHRLSFWIANGPIEGRMVIDHICRNRSCINPEHLRKVTHAENMRVARLTHCKRGHPLSGDNVAVSYQGNKIHRVCRTCSRESGRAYYARKKAAAAEVSESTD